MKYNFLFFLLLILSCVPPTEYQGVKLSLSDPMVQRIYNLQDQGQTDSLIAFFQEPDPSYRYLAAMAFASIRDTVHKARIIDSLATLLDDDFEDVRIAAAFAIGQTGDIRGEKPLVASFQRKDTLASFQRFNAAVLEAVGKCGSIQYLKAIATVKTYHAADTALLEGQTRAIYRYGLRNMIAPEGTTCMVRYAGDHQYPGSVRVLAANYLGRFKTIQLDSAAISVLSEAIKTDDDPRVRLALVSALGRTQQAAALATLLSWYPGEKDYRVRCSMLKALGNFEYGKVQPTWIAALKDPNLHVSNAAAQQFINSGQAFDATFYWKSAKDSTLPAPTRILLYQAANKYLPYGGYATYKGAINSELTNWYNTSSDPYEKAALLRALGEFGWNYPFIKAQGFNAAASVLKTTSVEVLSDIAQSPAFINNFGYKWRQVKSELGGFFLEALKGGDAGMIAVAAEVLRNPDLDFRALLRDSLPLLTAARQQLKLPKEIETYNELQQTIDYFLDKKTVAKTTDYNHPIDWKILTGLTERSRAVIETPKGVVTLKFYPLAAPGSVANFIKLAKDGFFNGKHFHRVVSGFVIQGGCPRGDGYGGLDYSIRTEIAPLRYEDDGYVGMASAGRNTECTQWFITHCPTPHLDGNYTIFAKVESGMEVVHAIQVGDVITKVSIVN